MVDNPMLNQLGLSSRSQSNNLIAMLANSRNPQQMIQNMIENNPNVNILVRQYGNGDPKTAFYNYARQTNQDPNQVLSALRNLGIK